MLTRGVPSWCAPSCSPIAAGFARERRGNKECAHIGYVRTQIIRMGAFWISVVLHFLPDYRIPGRHPVPPSSTYVTITTVAGLIPRRIAS